MKKSLTVFIVLGFLFISPLSGYSETVNIAAEDTATEAVGEISAITPAGINKTKLAWALAFDAFPIVSYSSAYFICTGELSWDTDCLLGLFVFGTIIFPFFSLPGDYIVQAPTWKKILDPVGKFLWFIYLLYISLDEYEIGGVPGGDSDSDPSPDPDEDLAAGLAIISLSAITAGEMYYHYHTLKHKYTSQLVQTEKGLYNDSGYSLHVSPFAWRDRVGMAVQVRF